MGLLFGKAGPAEYADEVVVSDEVVALRDRIDARSDESLRSDEAVLKVTLSDGRVLEKHVVHTIGSLEVPMSDEQLTRKFIDQAALVLGDEEAKKASEAAWAMGNSPDIAATIRSF